MWHLRYNSAVILCVKLQQQRAASVVSEIVTKRALRICSTTRYTSPCCHGEFVGRQSKPSASLFNRQRGFATKKPSNTQQDGLRIKEEKLSTSFSYTDFEEQLCNLLSDGQGKVHLSRLLRGIRNSGLWKNDPRLRESVTATSEYLVGVPEQNEVLIDREELKRCIKDNIVLIRRAFVGDFVIPDFSQFCSAIDEIYWACRTNTKGQVSTYIQPLSLYSPDYWGVSLCTIDGQRHAIGDTDVPFTVQSSYKAVNYALAINEHGADVVHQYVGHEPSGETVTSIKLNQDGRPHNPLINAGSLVVTALMRTDLCLADRLEYVMGEYKRMSGGEFLAYNNAMFLSEREIGDRNFALGYYLRENKCFPDGIDLHETMDLYFQLCSIEINVNSGAVIAATLANGGFCPITGEQVLSSSAVRNALSLMHSCGMYDYSGGFAFKVGLPGKSGISGGILLVVPNVMGMYLWSPPLDTMGNSVRGIQFCEQLVSAFNFHHYASNKSRRFDPRAQRSDVQGSHIVRQLFAAYNGDVTSLRRMSLAGYDMTAADYDGRTSLHLAAAEGHLDCVRFLLEKCSIPIGPKDRWGNTPYDDAVKFQRKDVQKYMEKFDGGGALKGASGSLPTSGNSTSGTS